MLNDLPELIVILAPLEICWLTSKTHCPPETGSIMIEFDEGSVDGGMF